MMAHDPFGGLSKLRPKSEEKPKEPAMKAEGADGAKTHTIEEHGDGTFTSHMHGGEPMQHPHHLHLMAHIGHHVTGGDKHHVVHHDGMEAHSHSMYEDGQHEDHEGEDSHGALDKFLGEEAQEPEHQGAEAEESPALGGM